MAPPEKLRLFVAIPLTDKIRARIHEAQQDLRRALRDENTKVRWTNPEQFHLTLKFLGAVPALQTDPLTEAIRDVGRRFAPLDLQARQVGFFPSALRPRVVWVGIHHSRQQLPLLQRAIEEAVAPFTEEELDEKFSGHITLGRIKEIRRSAVEQLSAAASKLADKFFGQWTANELILMRSVLSPQGAQHSPLADAELCGPRR